MTDGVLPAFPSMSPLPSPGAKNRLPDGQPMTFGALVDKEERQPSAQPRSGKPVREPASMPQTSEPVPPAEAPATAASNDAEIVLEPEDDGCPPRRQEKKEAVQVWMVCGLHQPPALLHPQRVQEAEGERLGDQQASAEKGTATTAEREAGVLKLDPGLQLAAMSLRQKLRASGEPRQAPSAGPVAEAAAVEPEADAKPGSRAPNRRLQAAAASLGLFGESRQAQAQPDRPAPARDAAKAKPDRAGVSAAAEKAEDPLPAPSAPEAKPASPLVNPLGGGSALHPSISPKSFGPFLAANVSPSVPSSPMSAASTEKASPANDLRVLEVRLHPVELGLVTAKLRINEQQLSVEITADSAEGKDSLAAQESAIRSSLEALGFRIDRLTIQHLAGSNSPNQNTGNSEAGPPQGGQAFGNAGGAGADNAGRNGQKAGGDGEEGTGGGISGAGEGMVARARHGGSGVFI